MLRLPRSEFSIGIYHVMMRGVNRQNYNHKNHRIGHLFQERFKSEPCNANSIDVDNTRRLKDDEVHELIIRQCGAATEDEFKKPDKVQREEIIISLLEEGASVRQIVSHTGYTTKQVRTFLLRQASRARANR